MPDVYSIAQLIVFGAVLALVWRRPLRHEGAGVMLASWVASNLAQLAHGATDPVLWFAVIDLVIIIWFCAIAWQHSAPRVRWAVVGAGCHLAALCIHAVRITTEFPSSFLYVSALNLLGYITVVAISAGPLQELGRRYLEHRSRLRNSRPVHGWVVVNPDDPAKAR